MLLEILVSMNQLDLILPNVILKQVLCIYTIYLGAAILIPLHETLIYPLLYRHSPWIESRHKILVGTVALVARVLTLMAYNVISRHNSLQMNGPNVNVTILCLFETSKGVLSKSFNYKWMFI